MKLPKFCKDFANYQQYLTETCQQLAVELPDLNAQQASFQLAQKICQKITEYGALEFERFMQMALYAQGLGYYSAGAQKFGVAGDFVTAPEISPLFAQSIARQFIEVFRQLEDASQRNILELGAGSGVFAVDCLRALEQKGDLPERYFILEISAELQQRQRQLLTDKVPHLLERIVWLNQLPSNFTGVIFANEVVDAIAVTLFKKNSQVLQEGFVDCRDQGFEMLWRQTESPESLKSLYPSWPLNYQAEYRKQAAGWVKALNDCLQSGVILLADYGYSESDLYSPNRPQGSLQCYYRQKKHANPLVLLGLQDITSSVDFTQLALAADKEGMQLEGFSTQAMFLLGAGIEHLAQSQASVTISGLKQGQQLKQLLMPEEMGETIKFLAFSKEWQGSLSGFRLQNNLHQL